MKKTLIILGSLLLCCGISFGVSADAFSDEKMAAFRNIFDTKIFHDPVIVKDIFQRIREQEKLLYGDNSEYVVGDGTQVYFNQQDSDILQKQIKKRVRNNKLLNSSVEEQEKAIEKDPHGALLSLIENYNVDSLTKEEFNTLNTVDGKAVSDAIDMMTEAGPDVGASFVPVVYNKDVSVQ